MDKPADSRSTYDSSGNFFRVWPNQICALEVEPGLRTDVALPVSEDGRAAWESECVSVVPGKTCGHAHSRQ